jgi:CheY-like chemotaxis protein
MPESFTWHGRILVTDEEEEVRKLVGKLLQQMEYEVELVTDSHRAIKACESAKSRGRPIDAVILNSTVRTGIQYQEVIRALFHSDPDVKAIVRSGYASDQVLTEPDCYGFKCVLANPFDAAKPGERITQVMKPVFAGQL